MRTAVINWTNRRVGGTETYLGQLLPELRRRGAATFFWHEQQAPSERPSIDGTADMPSCDATHLGLHAAISALRTWKPHVLFVQGLVSADTERWLLDVAPAVFFGHTYYGTCITGSKTVTFPAVRPCDRQFGPRCLLNFYPRRCGGLNPVTMLADYRRQASRLENLRRYDRVVTFSEHMRREFVKHGLLESRVHQLPAVDPMADAAPPLQGSAVSDGATALRLSFLGRLDRLKGCHVLLDALTIVQSRVGRRVHLTVAGDGPERERCERRAASIGSPHVSVTFTGWLSAEASRDLLASTDLVVVPSLWPEPFGLVGIEALRRGVPVAAFAVGGIPEWLTPGVSGALAAADPPTADGLAGAIVEASSSPQMSPQSGARLRLFGEASIAQHVDALLSVLSLAARSGRRAPDERES